MSKNKRVFWLAGEKSGDLHASNVLKVLKTKHPNWFHYGIGGPMMQQLGFNTLYSFKRFSVMGFVEVVKHLNFFLKVEKRIEKEFVQNPPEVVVLVDYPGLNMRIAKIAKNLSIPVIYFISPQFWAWKKKRIFKLKEYTDHIAYILPFEGQYFEDLEIPATYVGHPIAEEISVKTSRDDFACEFNLDPDKIWLGFLPGSRDSEVKKILPQYLKCMTYYPAQKFEFILSKADSVNDYQFKKILRKYPSVHPIIIENNNYCLMKHSNIIIATSGTATLETAYLGTPVIIVYKANYLSYAIGKKIVKIKRIGLPNIILDKNLAPELIQNKANHQYINKAIKNLLQNQVYYDDFQRSLKELHNLLGQKSAGQETARIIEDFVNGNT